MIDATGSSSVGNYSIAAVYLDQSNSTTVNMTGDNDIVLALNFLVPEFPSPLFLTLFMALALVGLLASSARGL